MVSPFDWVAIGSIATAIGSLATGISALLLFVQLRNEQNRSRRHLAYEMCFRWTERSEKEAHLILAFFESIGPEACKSIATGEPVTIEGEANLHRLCSMLFSRFPDVQTAIKRILDAPTSQKTIQLDRMCSAYLCQLGIFHLNVLESILVAWSSGMADRSIMEEQFLFICNEKDESTGLRDFRSAIGEYAFPSLKAFSDHLFVKQKEESKAAYLMAGKA